MYELYYWPGLQGRGEYVRLALEEAGADYRDVAREEGTESMLALIKDASTPPFAPPFLRDKDVLVGQTANILLYLGSRLGLAPDDEAGRLWTHQIQLTIADIVAEAHDSHHPIGSGLYYEEQKAEAKRYSENFRDERIPKFLGWFERVLLANRAGPAHLVGDRLTYADLSLFQIVEGLSYAFPKASARALEKTPHVVSLRDAVGERPNIRAYLASARREPFNQEGIFRHYPELDG
ncbi:glutathione S-transferase [Terrihabitans sp. B22-R8]|uniref:glutathione S-transferase n=1 Tax=Terrihabitans sp. B22-R8 TaxID=3425128 RepID=UPI00403C3D4D